MAQDQAQRAEPEGQRGRVEVTIGVEVTIDGDKNGTEILVVHQFEAKRSGTPVSFGN
jgi:hypothetical protein